VILGRGKPRDEDLGLDDADDDGHEDDHDDDRG